tara:strand:+ start:610 stop:873 length:264 start_codon:yes stop_codon:yes gene_type:complete
MPQENQMLGKKMTLKKQQEEVCREILRELSLEWSELEFNIQETVNTIILSENQDLMEDLFGTRFVHLAHLFKDSRTLLNDIEDLDND